MNATGAMAAPTNRNACTTDTAPERFSTSPDRITAFTPVYHAQPAAAFLLPAALLVVTAPIAVLTRYRVPAREAGSG